MKNVVKLLSVLMVLCMLLSSCAQGVVEVANAIIDIPEENGAANSVISNSEITNVPSPEQDKTENLSATNQLGTAPKGEYNEGVVLVKYDGEFTENVLAQLDFVSAEPLYMGSSWHTVTLGESMDTVEAVEYLTELDCFDEVDYDYIMGATDKPEDNPNYNDQVNLGLSNIPNGWTHNEKAPGGSPDVVVAVIDTGVDYNHLDLRNNIWVNPAEIPDNGIDDDGNGYIDDIRGWNCVGDNNDPLDDNGHGTHVAGIIAAENNKQGGIGVAYNCKVMVLKAGNSSGYFNNSDIAEAIQYAYMNGADVINMSFGGSNISLAVEEALGNAYTTSVLVAAAGNDGACNNLACPVCMVKSVSYPAALPYVIGVMSTNKDGKHISAFSNYDHYPYDSIEYEVYAVGEGVGSTWPSNKYACLNGTSMAAPTVAGIAALLRSYYSDREVYSTKFIQSQIVNTGTVDPYNTLLQKADDAHSVADVFEALTKLPKPAVNLYDYYIDDSVSISNKNNGNGVIDAGETVRLYISLHNRGGVASNVNVSIDTYRSEIGDETMTDPYFTFVNSTIQLSDIGTYSVRESGDKYFEIIVDGDCPNDYLVNFNIRFTYKNGLDAEDKTVYEDDGKQQAQFNVSRGFHLPATITEDTVYTADRLYIVGQDVVIPEGVTVTFEEGCEIQFYDGREYYNSPILINYGVLNMIGSEDKLINLRISEYYYGYLSAIVSYGEANIQYADIRDVLIYANKDLNVSDSLLRKTTSKQIHYGKDKYGTPIIPFGFGGDDITRTNITYTKCFIYLDYWNVTEYFENLNQCVIVYNNNLGFIGHIKKLENSIIYTPVNGVEYTINNVVNSSIHSINNGLSSLKLGNVDSISFSKEYQNNASQVIQGYYDATGHITVDVYGALADASLLWPHVVSVEIFDKDGNPITTVGKEEIKVRVTFNRPMDKNAGTFLTFGSIEPYGDYRIYGEYISDTVWEGTYTLKAQIENGQNFLKVNNAWAAEDQTKTVFGEYQLHEFTIDTTAAMSMNLLANPLDNGIELTFAQDDYDTLLGYNIYRSEEKDGNFVKLNPAILLPSESTFIDENAEPGKTYWYTYTVVLTDFTESNPAGKVQATAIDTLAPNMYHTPVNQGYMNNNLVISCTASDNVGIESVVLYYRTVGASEWKTLTMVKQNDKFSAKIFGNDLTLDGLEYYIVAYDANNSIAKGSAEAPYKVVVKDTSAISRKGDVDGDGVVTTKDALMLMQSINEERILTDDEFKRADLNNDGVLSSMEALRILQYINGNVNTLEM
ncbi:MAG: S8 family serine peptidase [Clostridia bacterium]|nr:S8 family serine peptidase [Clostridia bacterium]